MVTTNQTQRTYQIAAAEHNVGKQVMAFLLDRRIRGLASGTLRVWRAYVDDTVRESLAGTRP